MRVNKKFYSWVARTYKGPRENFVQYRKFVKYIKVKLILGTVAVIQWLKRLKRDIQKKECAVAVVDREGCPRKENCTV